MVERQGNPFEGVTDFFSELHRLRQTGTHGSESGHEGRQRTHGTAWVPATDILAREDDVVLRIELAGVRPEDVNITFSHGVLTVAGERKADLGAGGEDSFYVRERFYGAFRRVMTLPEGTASDAISAEFENGLVEITVRGAARTEEPARIELSRRS